MARDSGGVWEYFIPQVLYGKYYGYKVAGPSGRNEMFNPNILIGRTQLQVLRKYFSAERPRPLGEVLAMFSADERAAVLRTVHLLIKTGIVLVHRCG